MKLWILRPIEKDGDNPWNPWYDKAFGFVVRAETEEDARAMANADAGDENRGEFMGSKIADTKTPWLDPKYSTCEPLTADGSAGVMMQDFKSA
jgi:hypothetical protein